MKKILTIMLTMYNISLFGSESQRLTPVLPNFSNNLKHSQSEKNLKLLKTMFELRQKNSNLELETDINWQIAEAAFSAGSLSFAIKHFNLLINTEKDQEKVNKIKNRFSQILAIIFNKAGELFNSKKLLFARNNYVLIANQDFNDDLADKAKLMIKTIDNYKEQIRSNSPFEESLSQYPLTSQDLIEEMEIQISNKFDADVEIANINSQLPSRYPSPNDFRGSTESLNDVRLTNSAEITGQNSPSLNTPIDEDENLDSNIQFLYRQQELAQRRKKLIKIDQDELQNKKEHTNCCSMQ